MFNDGKGYGLIETNQEHDVFLRFSAIAVDCFQSVSEGEQGCFDEKRGAIGPQAVRMKKL